MKTDNMDVGRYIKIIGKKAKKIRAREKSGKVGRAIFLCLMVLACIGGIYFGVKERTDTIEAKYKTYFKSSDRSSPDNELLSYKDVSSRFETDFLGNKACQSLMGGFFYDGTEYSVYPDENCQKMILRFNDTEVTLCNGLASDINIKDGSIYYRSLNSRTVSVYNISDRSTLKLPLTNAGQFIICGDKLYYIDLSTSALIEFNTDTLARKEIIPSNVSSFIVIGRYIIYLNSNHVLYEYDIIDHYQTVIGNNISSFTYNGQIWMQSNDKVYYMILDKKTINNISIGVPCNRLLGLSGNHIYLEYNNGIYMYNTETEKTIEIAEGVFVGATDTKILVFNLANDAYQVFSTDGEH